MSKRESETIPFTIDQIKHWHNAEECNCETCKQLNEYYNVTEDIKEVWRKYGKQGPLAAEMNTKKLERNDDKLKRTYGTTQ